MLIIWKGLGFLIPFIFFLLAILVQLVVDNIFGTDYWKNNAWPLSFSLIATGLICWFLGKYLNSRPGKIVIDKETREEFEIRKTHSFFFIPFQYWGIICAVLGIVSYIQKVNS